MSRLMLRSIACYSGFIATAFAAQSPATPLQPQDLLLLQSTVASICTTVSLNGQKVDANVKLGITARVSKLFSQILAVDGNVSGSIERESWNGIATADAGSVIVANMNCRERAFEKLLAMLSANSSASEAGAASRAQTAHKLAPKTARRALTTRVVSRSRVKRVIQPVAPIDTGLGGKASTAVLRARTAAQLGDFVVALQEWLNAAELGDAQAQFEAAQIYDYGAPGVAPDCVAATKWYKTAAAHNLAAAEYNVGGEYFYGCKGHWEPEYAEALRWLVKAADDGSPDAEYEIGIIYLNGGAGVPQDRAAAREWLQKAAAHGNTRAIESLKNVGAS